MPGIGVIVNMLAVAVGSIVGLLFGRLIPERMRETTFRTIGLAVMLIGIAGGIAGLADLSAAEGPLGRYATLVFVISLVLGGIIGEALKVEEWLERFGQWLEGLSRRLPWFVPVAETETGELFDGTVEGDGELAQAKGRTIVEGFVTATLIFCVGAMTVVGSIQDGLGNPDTLYLKALLDGIASIALASALGGGVLLSVLPIGVLQGGIAVIAALLGASVGPDVISAIEAVGGALIFAVGLDLAGIKRLPLGNMLPGVFVAAIIAALLGG